MIALIDYGAGNLTSVRKALGHLGARFSTPTSPGDLTGARGIIVPGVGNFEVTGALGPEWRTAILEQVSREHPLLGICVGMQWLFDGSAEAPDHEGLAVMAGLCQQLPEAVAADDPDVAEGSGVDGRGRLKVPHVGWNSLRLTRASWLLDGVNEGDQVYFTHSFAAPVTDDCVGSTRYGVDFAAAVERGQVGGVQFHPEKSSDVGLRILGNFLRRVEG